MRQSVLVALALVALLLLPNKSFSQYQPPSETLVIRTDHASTWSDGQTTIILTELPVTIETDRARLSAQRAVLWLGNQFRTEVMIL